MNDNVKSIGSPKTSVPRVWIGLIFVVAPFLLLMSGSPGYEMQRFDSQGNMEDLTPSNPMIPYAAILLIIGWGYWIYCIHRMHKVLLHTKSDYPISPNKAAWFNLIPFYNLVWVFQWTNQIVKYVNENSSQKMLVGWTGAFLCFGLVITYLFTISLFNNTESSLAIFSIALGIIMIVGIFITKKIYKTITVV